MSHGAYHSRGSRTGSLGDLDDEDRRAVHEHHLAGRPDAHAHRLRGRVDRAHGDRRALGEAGLRGGRGASRCPRSRSTRRSRGSRSSGRMSGASSAVQSQALDVVERREVGGRVVVDDVSPVSLQTR